MAKAMKRKQEPSESTPKASIEDLVSALGDPGKYAPDEEEEEEPQAEAEAEETAEAAEDAPKKESIFDEDGGSHIRLVEALPIDKDDDLSKTEGEASPRLMSIVESILFAAEKPLTVKQLRKLLREPTANQIRLALKQLIRETSERGIVLTQVAGGFVLRTNPRNARWVQKFLQARPVRLSRAQLETLAIIAYKQPVTRAEIEHVRGVDSGAVIGGLLERNLVAIVGRKEEPGRPMLYGTTVKFLELFSLMSIKDLPDLQEFKELSDDTKDQLRKKHDMDESEVEALGQEVMEFADRPEEELAEELAEEGIGDGEGEDASSDDAESDGEAEEGTAEETEVGEDAPAEATEEPEATEESEES